MIGIRVRKQKELEWYSSSVGEETHLVGTLRLKSRPFATWISIQTLGLETNQVTMVPPFQCPLNLLSCLFSKNSGTGDGFYYVWLQPHETSFTNPYLRWLHLSGKQPSLNIHWPFIEHLPCVGYHARYKHGDTAVKKIGGVSVLMEFSRADRQATRWVQGRVMTAVVGSTEVRQIWSVPIGSSGSSGRDTIANKQLQDTVIVHGRRELRDYGATEERTRSSAWERWEGASHRRYH